MVFGVCEQTERAMVRGKDVTDKQKSETLALGLRGKERCEKVSSYRRRDAMTIVGNNELERSCRDGYGCISKFFILHS